MAPTAGGRDRARQQGPTGSPQGVWGVARNESARPILTVVELPSAAAPRHRLKMTSRDVSTAQNRSSTASRRVLPPRLLFITPGQDLAAGRINHIMGPPPRARGSRNS